MKKFIFVFFFVICGCLNSSVGSAPSEPILMATTTSTYDSGLLDYILPKFKEENGSGVNVISVGTGQAIELGRRGDVDVILVHSPEDERRFVLEGYGIERFCVMYNGFVLLGPEEDPAGVKELTIVKAFEKITAGEYLFISRGDDSGTNKRELLIWGTADIVPEGNWYEETGTGMGQTLLTADEKKGYVLSDKATYLAFKDRLSLVELISDDEMLVNPYAVIAVNPKIHPEINSEGAKKFVSWIVGDDAQSLISNYRVQGEALFEPLYGECVE